MTPAHVSRLFERVVAYWRVHDVKPEGGANYRISRRGPPSSAVVSGARR